MSEMIGFSLVLYNESSRISPMYLSAVKLMDICDGSISHCLHWNER